MILLGALLLILGIIFGVGILSTLGTLLLVIGVVLYLLGVAEHAIGPRNHYW